MLKTDTFIKSFKFTKIRVESKISSVLYKYGGLYISLLLLKMFTHLLWKQGLPLHVEKPHISHHLTNLQIGMTLTIMGSCIPLQLSGRLWKKTVSGVLSSYLFTEKFIDDSKHIFLKDRSCLTFLFQFFNLVFTHFNQGYLVQVLYVDNSKSLDIANDKLLIGEFPSYGIENNLLVWFNSFFGHRHQMVKCVVQGSVFSRLHLLAYINYICDCFLMIEPNLYVNDRKIVHSYLHD